MGVGSMKVKTGYIYHIKDEFFDIVNDEKLMTNHERGKNVLHILLLKIKIFYGLFHLVVKLKNIKKLLIKKIKNMVAVIPYLLERF